MQSVFKFSDVLFALKSHGPPWYWHLVAKTSTNLGQADLWSDVPPGRGIWGQRPVLHQVSLTFCQPLGQVDLFM